ncbi:MAG: transcriptional regulator, AsnC family [Dehalococcoidia bacterium]|nr:transcriptional regulator, AsnC family [Dehalococcoidia bacterium]
MRDVRTEILDILERNARATPQEISEMTGVPEEEVKGTIAAAERDRIIVKYKTLINWERAGTEEVLALVEIRVTPQRDVGFDSVAQRIARFPEVRSLHLVSGDFDLSVLLAGKSMKEVANFVAQKLAALEEVRGTSTHFLLKRYKQDGEIFDGEDGAKRLPLTP